MQSPAINVQTLFAVFFMSSFLFVDGPPIAGIIAGAIGGFVVFALACVCLIGLCYRYVQWLQPNSNRYISVEFCKGARQSGLVSVWQHTLGGQQLQGFL